MNLNEKLKRILIIRFSSFGDIAQCLQVAKQLKEDKNYDVHFLTKSDFSEFLKDFDFINSIWSYNRKEGIRGLFQLCLRFNNENYDFIYDAHNNIRSLFVKIVLKVLRPGTKVITRSKNRLLRFLLFKFRINLLPNPFQGIKSYLSPMGLSFKDTKAPPAKSIQTITISPSANWELKRWPIEYWKKLIEILPNYKFQILGGEKDVFCEDIKSVAPERVINLAGAKSWRESAQIINKSEFLISGDTGTLHLADFYEVPNIVLIGPTAFGYPSRSSSNVLETHLSCKPCSKDGRGKCNNKTYKACLMALTPDMVKNKFLELTQ